jgi:TolB-like protein/Tfp pilus assembly protein PilF
MADRAEPENLQEPNANTRATGDPARVFISYASYDATVAQKVCSALEAAGVRCWMAPRDVVPGTLYADGIVRAINDSLLLVVILSEHSIHSAHVGKELERAASKRHPIIALRVDVAPLTPALEYFLSESQWIEIGAGGADAAAVRLIDAVRRHLAPGSVTAPDHSPAAHTTSRVVAARQRSWFIVAVAALALGAAYFLADKLWLHRQSASADRTAAGPAAAFADNSIAVLPFTDMSERKDQEYFADGMAEEVLDLLVKLPGLKVIGRTSSFQFKGKSEDLRTIGTRLGATYLVEGSVRKAGPRIRVTAQLIDARSGVHRWSQTYDRDFGDVLALQDEIAMGIARSLQLAVDAEGGHPMRRLHSAEAYTLYLEGRVAQDQQNGSALVESLHEFEQALALDPSFSLAAEALALTHVQMGFDEGVPPRAAWQQARQAAERALLIEPRSARAHGVLGLVHALNDCDWAAAEAEFSKALALNPRDPVTLAYVGRVAYLRGLTEEALRRINESLGIDPLNPYTLQLLGQMLYSNGDYDGAELAFRKSIAISATFDGNRWNLTRILLMHGQIDAALAEIQAEVSPDAKDAGLAIIYHAQHRKTDSDAALARLIKADAERWPYGVAVVYGYRGERDKAIEWMQKAVEARDSDMFIGFRGDPEFALARADPRYAAILRKMNLPVRDDVAD